jgi:hypothetical protein
MKIFTVAIAFLALAVPAALLMSASSEPLSVDRSAAAHERPAAPRTAQQLALR